MIQKYMFLTHLRVKDFFYKIILIYFQWANKWQLNMSLSKCEVMTLGKVTPSKYCINNFN